MKILVLAPQPFFQVRGTPIAIDLLVSTLSKQGHEIDLVTYHEGDDRHYDKVNHIRTPSFSLLNGIQPGLSFKKIICSGLLFFSAFALIRKNKYDLIHANEEAVFIAYLFKKLFKKPYIYDMDSSLVAQMIDKRPFLKRVRWVFAKFENLAIANSLGVLAVCEALCEIARPHNRNVQLLTDVAMLDQLQASSDVVDLEKEYKLAGVKLMYIGNLESYQGVDLMIEGFVKASQQTADLSLLIIGGTNETIETYQKKCRDLNVSESVIFIGPKPFSDIEAYMSQADVLVSPRTQGDNTPMKIYNYMASGKAIIATDIYSHTQVLDSRIAELVSLDANDLALAISKLSQSQTLREELGRRCRAYANDHYSVASFETTVKKFFEKAESMAEVQLDARR